jgi:YbbR domain-containing protein
MFYRFAINVRLFAWALVLALAVWVAAVTSSDPDEVRVYPTPVNVQIVGQDSGLVITNDVPHQVEVTLRAPRSIWEQLTARSDSLRATLDLSALSAGQHQVNLQIQVDARPAQVVKVNPSSVEISLETLVTKTVPFNLNLSGQPAIGYQAGDPTADVKSVLVAGAQSQVGRVKQVGASINLDGLRESIDSSIPITALDDNGQPVSGISLQPQTVHVSLPLIQQGGFRDMAVKVIVHGQVASGYRLDNISVFPPVVTVFSSYTALINSLPGVVETQPLDLQGTKDNITTRLNLNLPPGVSIIGEQTVLIQAGISAIESSITLSNEKVEVTGLQAGTSAQVSPASVDVILSGPLPLLDTLAHQDIHVTVDVTGLNAGTHQLTPIVQILISNIKIESILPGTVEVILSPSPTPTP